MNIINFFTGMIIGMLIQPVFSLYYRNKRLNRLDNLLKKQMEKSKIVPPAGQFNSTCYPYAVA